MRIAQNIAKTVAQRINSRTAQDGGCMVRRYAADAHGEVKYNAWEKPTEIAKWKEEHIVIAVLSTWGIVITSAMKMFGGKKEPAAEASSA